MASNGASLVAQLVKNLPAMQETWVQFLSWEDSLEKGKATDPSILAWRIPQTTDHGVTMIRYDCPTFTFNGASQVVLAVKNLPASAGDTRDAVLIPALGGSPGGTPTPRFLPGESHGQRSLVGYSPCGHKESDMTEQLTHTSAYE